MTFTNDDYDKSMVRGSIATFVGFVIIAAGGMWSILHGRANRKI
jgi:hypothetical protein